MINKVTLIGHLGQDPEVRRLENGTPVGRFSLATSESYRDGNNEWQTLTEWHNIVVWRDLAERAEKSIKKGALVYIEGKLTHRKYTDKNGIERISTDIVANTFRGLEKRDGGNNFRDAQFPTQEPVTPVGRQSQGSNEQVFEVVAPLGDAPEPSDDLPF
jgi:single-strand DNA-binding protein